MANVIQDLVVTGTLTHTGGGLVNASLSGNAAIARTKLAQDTFQSYVINPTTMRVWDAFHTVLPGTAANDDLAIITGTWGTDAVTIQSSDGKATTITQRLAFVFSLPPEYDTGESVRIRVRAGAVTTVSDDTMTVDCEVHKWDGDGAVGADICTTAAQDANDLTKADLDFTVTSSSLAAGDVLAVRITAAITDAATATAVICEISKVAVQCDIRG